MDEFKSIFYTECGELLTDMEERLMRLEEGVHDPEALNAIFRCAHSIKGGAGAFGLDAIMNFTHILEALLDQMRTGALVPDRHSIDLLLKSADIVTKMLSNAQNGQDVPAGTGADIAAQLQSLTQNGPGAAPVAHSAPSPAAPVPVAAPVAPVVQAPSFADVQDDGDPVYDITFAPHPMLFANGNEPLLILRGLQQLGRADITADLSYVPALDALEATACYLRWIIQLHTTAPEADIRDVFEFVDDCADITITRHGAPPVMTGAPEQKVPVEIVPAETAVGEVAETAKPAVVAAPLSVTPAASSPAAATAPAAAAGGSIRVDLDKIDRLVNMVGELVITEAMLRAQMRHLPLDQHGGLMNGLHELSQHTRELQEAVMAVRMQPVKSLFLRMPRVVRDTAALLNKNIQLVMLGENTEVDKTVIESLSDPLTHMIRNSVDHGIETPDQRVWNDKPEQGTITLSAYHRSGRIIIEIKDDGAGINRAKVLAKAKEKGLVAPEAQPSDEEIDHMVFLAGFSTAEKVTNVSGRGVGMDVVRRNIEALGGTVRITNNPGIGSTFTVSLPLTLAILDGMIVRVGQENYIVPITSIIETMRPKAGDVHSVTGRADVINVRGEFVPLVHLSRIFAVPGAQADMNKNLIVLAENGEERMGLVVDELVGQQQVVIKSLEANADPVKGISGATILGDGKVSLILEINELKALCSTLPGSSSVQSNSLHAA